MALRIKQKLSIPQVILHRKTVYNNYKQLLFFWQLRKNYQMPEIVELIEDLMTSQ